MFPLLLYWSTMAWSKMATKNGVLSYNKTTIFAVFVTVDITERLTYRKIFYFWGPLALTWLLMAFEQPFLIAFIARLSDAKYNLEAFGIAGSFAMII